jgi:hypothetical protein
LTQSQTPAATSTATASTSSPPTSRAFETASIPPTKTQLRSAEPTDSLSSQKWLQQLNAFEFRWHVFECCFGPFLYLDDVLFEPCRRSTNRVAMLAVMTPMGAGY